MAINIANKLEVLLGNKIVVPGCEPTSAFTSPTLAENRECAVTVVDLADALEAVSGSSVVYMRNPRRKFFVLPNGPAPSPDNCTSCRYVEDWYAKLRAIGQDAQVDSIPSDRPLSIGEICEAFPLRGIF